LVTADSVILLDYVLRSKCSFPAGRSNLGCAAKEIDPELSLSTRRRLDITFLRTDVRLLFDILSRQIDEVCF